MSIDLKPCPFCGGEAVIHRVATDRCFCGNPDCWMFQKINSLEAWNTRYEAAKDACQDEGCPHYGKAIKCEPNEGGCLATVPEQPVLVSLEKCARKLYCDSRRPDLLWPRIFSWEEYMDKHLFIADAKAVLGVAGVRYVD